MSKILSYILTMSNLECIVVSLMIAIVGVVIDMRWNLV